MTLDWTAREHKVFENSQN